MLGTAETLELLTKPKAASLAAGRREYPGGRSPDFGRLDFAAFELEAFLRSVKMNQKENFSVDSKMQNAAESVVCHE